MCGCTASAYVIIENLNRICFGEVAQDIGYITKDNFFDFLYVLLDSYRNIWNVPYTKILQISDKSRIF